MVRSVDLTSDAISHDIPCLCYIQYFNAVLFNLKSL